MQLEELVHKLEWEYGTDMVRWELEKVAVKRNAPHLPDWCKDCTIDPMGEWKYCRKGHYHPEHPHHTCPVNAPCYCRD